MTQSVKPPRSPARRLRRLVLAMLLLAALGGGAYALFGNRGKPVKMVTAPVTQGDIEESVLASGTLEAFKQVSVGAQVSGQIKALHVELGQKVKTGDLIAEIDSVTQENNVRNAEAALANIRAQRDAKQAQLKQFSLAYARQKAMLAQNATARETYESAEAALQTARADIAALDAQITQAAITADTAKVNLGYTKITAPLDGTVVAILYQEGQTVNSVQQAPTIIKLAQLDTMTVKAQISEADVPRVKPEQKVYFTILGEPDRRYYAKLRAVEPAPDSIENESATTTGSSASTAIYYNGLFDTPNPDGKLRISMTAQVTIVLGEAKQALMIPRGALGEAAADGSYTVQVAEGGKARPQRVRIGLNNGVNVEIKEGLRAGQHVVVGAAAEGSSPSSQRRIPMMRL